MLGSLYPAWKAAKIQPAEAMRNDETVLKIENLTKTFTLGKRKIQPLNGLDLEVSRGEFTAIMGPSGSGKTTLLNLIGCIDKPSDGKIAIDSVDISHMPESQLYKIRRDKIGFVFQNFNLLPYLNARENVELAMELAGKFKGQRKQRALELLGTVGLSGRAQHRPQHLSQGEQQRVAIARALANEPSHHLSRRTHRQLGCRQQTGNRKATLRPQPKTRHDNHYGDT